MSPNKVIANVTILRLGAVDIKLVFSRINITFLEKAVFPRNLLLPIMLGIHFLKNNSLSPFLTHNEAKLVHTPSNQSQAFIANISW